MKKAKSAILFAVSERRVCSLQGKVAKKKKCLKNLGENLTVMMYEFGGGNKIAR